MRGDAGLPLVCVIQSDINVVLHAKADLTRRSGKIVGDQISFSSLHDYYKPNSSFFDEDRIAVIS